MIVPTVKIKFPANLRHGYAIINESDFDPAIHELLEPDPLDHDGDGKRGGIAPIEIPADWADLHHTKQIALAKALAGADIVPAEGQTVTEAAREIIAVAVAERAAA